MPCAPNILEPVMRILQKAVNWRISPKKIKNRKADPYSVAEEIAQRFFKNREEK